MTDTFIDAIVSAYEMSYAAADALEAVSLDRQRTDLIRRLQAFASGRSDAEWRAFYEAEAVRLESIRIGEALQ